MPKVSVIMPSFNSDRNIEQAIKSVLNQTHHNLELIVIDGGSTDTTAQMIDQLSLIDSRIIFIHNTDDDGPAHARQVGIELSVGKYIAFLDADDYWLPEKIKEQLKFMENNDIKFSYTGYRSINDKGGNLSCPVIMKKTYDLRLGLMYRGIGILTVMIEKKILSKDIISSRSNFAEDYLWWLLILNKGYKAHLCNIDSARYRISKNSRSKNRYKHQLSLWKIYKENFSLSSHKAFFYYFYYFFNTAFNKIRIYFCSKISNIVQ